MSTRKNRISSEREPGQNSGGDLCIHFHLAIGITKPGNHVQGCHNSTTNVIQKSACKTPVLVKDTVKTYRQRLNSFANGQTDDWVNYLNNSQETLFQLQFQLKNKVPPSLKLNNNNNTNDKPLRVFPQQERSEIV